MSASVSPGYNFQPTEVPTYAKFIAQVLGLTITNLDYEGLGETTQFYYNGQATDGSGASQTTSREGALWYDPSGQVQVTCRITGDWWGASGYSGPEYVRVPLFKPWSGGWDTIRGTKIGSGGSAEMSPMHGDGDTLAGYTPSSILRTYVHVSHNTGGPKDGGYPWATGASGYYSVVTGRGGGRMFHAQNIANGDLQTVRFYVASGTDYAVVDLLDPGVAADGFGLGEITHSLNVSAASDTNWNGLSRMWVYGRTLGNNL